VQKKKICCFDLLGLWFPVFVWALVIFAFSARPTTSVSEIHWKDFIVKKTAHVVEFAILAILIYRALINSGVSKKKAGYYSIFLSVVYGFSDEFHQSFTPGRDPKLRDVIFDTMGAIIAIYSIWNILPKAPKKLKNWAEKLRIS
jgi:VanZ family protein